ncbi:hypothetical protein ACIQAC_37880 [Streptomyces sp. NPDC088387]|uniref:hypothetical protein n=1 Tax=Streptomyces sp. NPDC088387 TaxID=3365859 RepID=UPI003827B973
MISRTGTGRCVRVLLAAALAVGALGGCRTLLDAADESGCDGTGGRVDALRSDGVLDSRPPGATVPDGFEKADAGCWQDSGEAWLYAERTYVFPGDKGDLLDHYRAVAGPAGWKLSRTDRSAGLCFTPATGEGTSTLNVRFLTAEDLKAQEPEPGPEFGSGAGYSVALSATADGSPTGCSD